VDTFDIYCLRESIYSSFKVKGQYLQNGK